MLYTLNFHNIMCQLYLSLKKKKNRETKQMWQDLFLYSYNLRPWVPS